VGQCDGPFPSDKPLLRRHPETAGKRSAQEVREEHPRQRPAQSLPDPHHSAEERQERRVDIVLDNAGFELFVDLILAGYLLSSGLATSVVFHPKSIPWFVSDVLPADFGALLSALADPSSFYEALSEDEKHAGKEVVPLSEVEAGNLHFLFENWSTMHAEGELMLRPNDFWTAGGSYWRLPKTEPELYEDLKESELVIFKGDLNYRKLTADVSTNLC
jgi:hypothetical protein